MFDKHQGRLWPDTIQAEPEVVQVYYLVISPYTFVKHLRHVWPGTIQAKPEAAQAYHKTLDVYQTSKAFMAGHHPGRAGGCPGLLSWY
jgi:hypothetical protein